jgi:hypothetical protein
MQLRVLSLHLKQMVVVVDEEVLEEEIEEDSEEAEGDTTIITD